MIDKNFYNEASALKLGWDPTWFGEKHFDDDLIKSIRRWQKKNGLTADGMCGPATYRRVYNERISSEVKSGVIDVDEESDSFLVCAGKKIPIDWPRVVLWTDNNGLKINRSFSPYIGKKRKITMFVNHWDVCLNSETCVKVLNRRNISVHFCIDNDGTIYQLMDLNDAAWHASSRKVNHKSLGVEIANAYYLKYQPWYKRNGFGERPIISGAKIHGKPMKDFTDFYPVQKEALKALWRACHKEFDIPYECPLNNSGEQSDTTDASVKRGTFKGFINHYNVVKSKIDCAGLPIKEMLEHLKKEEDE